MINQKILEMRNQKARLFTILKEVVKFEPYCVLDESLALARLLFVLDSNNLAVSRAEVRSCFNKFYNRDFHADKKGFLNWYYKDFHVKSGTITCGYQNRPQASKKQAISCIYKLKKAQNRDFKGKDDLRYTNTLTEPKLKEKEEYGAVNV